MLIASAATGSDLSWVERFACSYRRLRYNKILDGLLRIVQRDQPDEFDLDLTTTPVGEFWEPVGEGSQVIAQLAEIQAKYEWLQREPIEPGDVVFDCGASVGLFTKEALRRGARLVVAFEPTPGTIMCFRRNLASEISEGRVILYPKAVWNEKGLLPFYLSDETPAMNSLVREGNAVNEYEVEATTIDDVVAELQLDRLDFIKMDIEGAEEMALRGAQETLRRFRPHLELEVSENHDSLIATARQAWSGYQSECIYCWASPAEQRLIPALVWLY